MFAFIPDSFTALIGKNKMLQKYNTDSKIINIASCKACKNISLVVENVILIQYYYHSAKQVA